MNSGGSNTNVNTLSKECIRLQLFRYSFEKVVESLGKHFRLEDVERQLNKISPKDKAKRVYDYMVEDMKTVLFDCISGLNIEDLNCKLKILEEVTREGVYDAQPKWRPSGVVEEQATPHITAAKLNLKQQLERDLEEETAEVNRLKDKTAKKRKVYLKLQRKYNKLSKQHSSIYTNLESLTVLETDVITNLKRKFDEVD